MPASYIPITVRVLPEFLEEMDAAATERGMSRQAFMIAACAYFIHLKENITNEIEAKENATRLDRQR